MALADGLVDVLAVESVIDLETVDDLDPSPGEAAQCGGFGLAFAELGLKAINGARVVAVGSLRRSGPADASLGDGLMAAGVAVVRSSSGAVALGSDAVSAGTAAPAAFCSNKSLAVIDPERRPEVTELTSLEELQLRPGGA